MGMSHDYKIALNYGATLIRVGTILFGSRWFFSLFYCHKPQNYASQ
jgi:hypothetical protein